MRPLLLSLLRSRVGIAAVIVAVVLLVVGISRLTGGSADPPSRATPPELVTTQGVSEPDDGVAATQEPVESPVVASGTLGPVQVAEVFAGNWVQRSRSADAWIASLKPNATKHLLEQLQGVDPVSVPATRVTGPAQLIPHSAALAEVELPLDAGVLLLRLVGPEGRWQVDGIDWSRS
jgi:hypothetical protein